jgi:hypothetical protein
MSSDNGTQKPIQELAVSLPPFDNFVGDVTRANSPPVIIGPAE